MMKHINCEKIEKILLDTAYVRTVGSKKEHECAEYIKSICEEMGYKARLEAYKVRMYDIKEQYLCVDGKEIKCEAIGCSGNVDVKAPLYRLECTDEFSLSQCRGKIVLSDKPVGYALRKKLCDAQALAYISHSGSIHHGDSDIDKRRLTVKTAGNEIAGVHIHTKSAIELVKGGFSEAQIHISQREYEGTSNNVVLDLEGESEEMVVITAHYDSTSLSVGSYDNMSGCIGLLYLADFFSAVPHKRKIRLLWCGGEEYGLFGSRAYCRDHTNEKNKTYLNINLDMLGCTMGTFTAFSCIDEKMSDILEKFALQNKMSANITYGIRSSDQNSFLITGIPAVSFARYAVGDTGLCHVRYDVPESVSAKQLTCDMEFIASFTKAVCDGDIAVPREISEKIRIEAENHMKYYAELL